MIQAAAALIWASMVASMIQAAAAPIWTSAISPFPLRLPQRPPRRFVSSSLTTEISLLSLSDKSAVDGVGDLDVDCATESFCSSCAIPPRVVGMVVGGLWSDGVGCDLCAATATTAAVGV